MKSVLITGANRGIGSGFVEYFQSNGYKVFAGIRNTDNYEPLENVVPVKLDVSNDQSIADAFQFIKSNTNSLEFLINNAGVNKDSATNNQKEKVCNLINLDRDSLLKMFDVNSISPLIIVKNFISLLSDNPSWIINISSARASYNDEFENSTANYGYRASKAGLNMLTFASVHDLPSNVKTFSVHPGNVLTDMNSSGDISPLESSKMIISITKNWSDEYNGRFMRFDGTLYPL